jgi:hypothetical protein
MSAARLFKVRPRVGPVPARAQRRADRVGASGSAAEPETVVCGCQDSDVSERTAELVEPPRARAAVRSDAKVRTALVTDQAAAISVRLGKVLRGRVEMASA